MACTSVVKSSHFFHFTLCFAVCFMLVDKPTQKSQPWRSLSVWRGRLNLKGQKMCSWISVSLVGMAISVKKAPVSANSMFQLVEQL